LEAAEAHPAVRAWRLISTGQDGPSLIDALEDAGSPRELRLKGAGPGGADVIAKRFDPRGACLERRLYEEVLPWLPSHGLHLLGSAEVEEEGWLFLQDTRGAPYSLHSPGHRVLAARWLARMHLASARLGIGAMLPDAGPGHFLGLLRKARVELPREGSGEFIEAILARLDLLEEHWDVIESWCEGMPRTLVQGAFVDRKLRVRGEREVMPYDWETAGWGVPAIDLAQSLLQLDNFAASPDLTAYASLLRASGCGISEEVVFRISVCGKVFRCLADLSGSAGVDALRVYGTELADAMGERGLSFCRSASLPSA
jgi:hypothetical protein